MANNNLRKVKLTNSEEKNGMKLATYSTSDDATPKVGLVRDKELVPLADKGFEGVMTAVLQVGIDINSIEE